MVMGHACVSAASKEQPVSFVKKTTNLAHFVIKVSVTKIICNEYDIIKINDHGLPRVVLQLVTVAVFRAVIMSPTALVFTLKEAF